MSKTVEKIAKRVLKIIDDDGHNLPLAQWIELLEEVDSEVRSRLSAARDDLRRRGGG